MEKNLDPALGADAIARFILDGFIRVDAAFSNVVNQRTECNVCNRLVLLSSLSYKNPHRPTPQTPNRGGSPFV